MIHGRTLYYLIFFNYKKYDILGHVRHGNYCKAEEEKIKLVLIHYLCNGVSKYQYHSSFVKKNFGVATLEIKLFTGIKIQC